FGFSEAQNLMTAALGGFVYIIAAWQGGKLAQRYGCMKFLYLGCFVMAVSLTAGLLFSSPPAQIIVYCLWTAGVCLVWPALEAMISERAGASLPKMIGIYNVTWACGGAVAYFTAGILIENLGMASLFWLPLGITVAEAAILPLASRYLKQENLLQNHEKIQPAPVSPAHAKRFLLMAWIANPFSYVAINTVIPLIPSIAENLGLSTGQAGILCSLWMFARLAAFILFWQWTGWHYRFRWLAGSFLLMIACFFGFLTAGTIRVLLTAQLGFGLSIGLIYYSSLYYSMNVEENQGANAGLHEAMIGAGLFAGPAIGAAALYLVPAAAGMGAWSVGGLLCLGFSGMLFVNRYRKESSSRFF
ncbi:MAG TPA: MFS transporter, partial [Smithellaceae bacterium]|nr:MFS transporter [Smithellaceae bacterium]